MKSSIKIGLSFMIIVISAILIIIILTNQPDQTRTKDIDDFLSLTGTLQNVPSAIEVSDENPFYALIATPLAVHYSYDGTQEIVPLYVKNLTRPSNSLLRLQIDQLSEYKVTDLMTLKKDSVKNFSLNIASKYWEKSDAAMIIENSKEGYYLGVNAAPIASYLSIPILIADKIDEEILFALDELHVKNLLICGENITGYKGLYSYRTYVTIDEIVNESVNLVKEKFGEVGYITLANPIDGFPSKILDTSILIAPEKHVLKSSLSLFPQNFINSLITQITGGDEYVITIPEDYKYALINLKIRNLEPGEYIEKFGDNLCLGGSLTNYLRTTAYPAERDKNGNILEDRLEFETIFYNQGGEEYNVVLFSSYGTLRQAEYEISVTAEHLENPYYSMLPKFSSLAPYLASYHQGVVFADPIFAFAPTDKVTYNDEIIPGNTQVLYNPSLIPVINQHVYEKIHLQINELLLKIRNNIHEKLLDLQKSYSENPVYIGLLGDTIMLPQYYYRSPHSDPFEHPTSGAYGTNCPSDFIYGNIDPEIYSLEPYPVDHLENDLFTNYPFAENIVGRISGYNVQDASALIARTVFYEDVLTKYNEWKDNATVLIGAGCEMQKLPGITGINKLFFNNHEPQKFPSGEKYFLMERLLENFEQGGFTSEGAERGRAQMSGYTWESLMDIWKASPGNMLWFRPLQIKIMQGIENKDSLKPRELITNLLGNVNDVVIGGQIEKNSNFIISDSHAIWFEKEHGDVLLHSLGMPFSRLGIFEFLSRFFPLPLRSPLDLKGAFDVREVSNVDMGPSVMLVEGCGSGKIDGMPPKMSLANTYLHAGVNAYISPTTLSAFYGALEPRFGEGIGFGILGYLKAKRDARAGEYPPVHFNQWIFEHALFDMFENDISIGTALRNAKNAYLPDQLEKTYRWTPPLSISSRLPLQIVEDILTTKTEADNRFPVEKYCTIYQINLLGDPAFNPYEPCNEVVS